MFWVFVAVKNEHIAFFCINYMEIWLLDHYEPRCAFWWSGISVDFFTDHTRFVYNIHIVNLYKDLVCKRVYIFLKKKTLLLFG
jgi:hypothetical protein